MAWGLTFDYGSLHLSCEKQTTLGLKLVFVTSLIPNPSQQFPALNSQQTVSGTQFKFPAKGTQFQFTANNFPLSISTPNLKSQQTISSSQFPANSLGHSIPIQSKQFRALNFDSQFEVPAKNFTALDR